MAPSKVPSIKNWHYKGLPSTLHLYLTQLHYKSFLNILSQTIELQIHIIIKIKLPQIQIINPPPKMPSSVNHTNFLEEEILEIIKNQNTVCVLVIA